MAALAAAGIGAATSLFNGITGKNAAKKAAAAQTASFDKALAQQQAQTDQSRADFSPFLAAGTGALGQTQDILGLHGNDPQAAAIAVLKASPAFTSLYGTGQDTVLQNAAATGGLRGGNTETGLAQFGSGLLAQVIQQQLGNLGGLVNIGSGTAGQLGALGQANSSALSNLLTGQGKAQATGILGGQAIQNNTANDLSKILQGIKW